MSELEQCLTSLEKIGMSLIRKSVSGQPEKVMKAIATAEATKTQAGAILARRILQLEQQAVIRKSFEPIIKSMGLSQEPQEDEWSSMFSKADGLDDEADEEDELRRELRDLADREREITARIRELHFGGR